MPTVYQGFPGPRCQCRDTAKMHALRIEKIQFDNRLNWELAFGELKCGGYLLGVILRHPEPGLKCGHLPPGPNRPIA